MRWFRVAQNCPVPRHLCSPSMSAWTYLPLHVLSAMTGAVVGCACGAAAGAVAAPAKARLSAARIGTRRFMAEAHARTHRVPIQWAEWPIFGVGESRLSRESPVGPAGARVL